MSAVFVYVTTPSEVEAESIAHSVVTDGLAACANIIPGMKSIYRWKGKVEEAAETVLILKTRAGLFSELEARVKEMHSYDTPCIAALPVEGMHRAYLEWILAETKA